MGRPFELECFADDMPLPEAPAARAADAPPPPELDMSDARLEEVRLEAFEQGYKAGWDDAAKAQTADHARVGAELARNIADMGFTLHEARAHILGALEPLLRDLVDKILPRMLHDTTGRLILETVLPMAEATSASEMEIVVAPDSRAAVEKLLTEETGLAVRVVEEATLADGQAYLRVAQAEAEIDTAAVHARVAATLQDIFPQQEKALAHG